MDPLAGSNWSRPEVVAGFSTSPPNQVLLGFADAVAARVPGRHRTGRAAGVSDRTAWTLAPMERIPVGDDTVDLVVAHGIWNLASSARVFRTAVAEAARVARPGAGLFVFTFSRATLPQEVNPVDGEPFVFTQFSGVPQCFLTYDELREELASVGFTPDPSLPVTEHNRPAPGARRVGAPPVIWECAFRLG